MFPNINEKAMRSAMKRMGMKQEDVDALEVIIKTSGENIVIKNPSVQKVDMMGQVSFQVSGEISTEKREIEISSEDISTVIEQTSASKEDVIDALKSNNGDIAGAILSLKKKLNG